MTDHTEQIVIVGAGPAGLRAAERLRELGFGGRLMIIGSEPDMPYHRPALSKQLIAGTATPPDVRLAAPGDVDAVWRFNTTAVHLQPRRRVVHLPGAEEVRYDGLVIATGVEPRRLPSAPYDHPSVFEVRTLADAMTLRHGLAASEGPVAVIGGGFLGCEIASTVRELGREAIIVSQAPTLLGDTLGSEVGRRLTSLHSDNGVRLSLGTSIRRWLPERRSLGIQLVDGNLLEVACAVIAVGTVPSVSWLRGAGLPIADGLTCGPTCHVVGTDSVVAAGDVAQWPNLRFGQAPQRVEHWLNAVEMGCAAAESLMAGSRAARPFAPVPRFSSEQHGVRIQVAGVPALGTDTVELSPPEAGDRSVTGFVRDGRLVGVVCLNSPAAMLSWTAEIAEQNPVSRVERENSRAPGQTRHRPAGGGAHRRRSDVVAGG